jgi:hypothetical protein
MPVAETCRRLGGSWMPDSLASQRSAMTGTAR